MSRGGRGGGALLVAGVCVAAGCNDRGSTAPSSPAPAPSAVSTPVPLLPTLPPAPTQPVSLAVKLNPNPPSGAVPLDLHVSLCGSRPVPPVDLLRVGWDRRPRVLR